MSGRRGLRAAAWMLAGAAALAASAATAGDGGPPVSGSTGVVVRSWTTTGGTGRAETRISQTFVPLRASVRLGGRADLVLISGGAAARLAATGGDVSLNGLRALAARLFLPVAGDRALIELALTAPSGKSKLTADQLRVAQSLGLPLLGFGLRQYGSGTEAGAGFTAFVLRQDELRISLGAAGTVRGAFEMARGEGDFRPASEWAVTAGADLGVSDDGPPLRLDLAWRSFGADELAGREVFDEGDQLEARLDFVRRAGDLLYRGWARSVIKRDNRAPASVSLIPGEYRANSGDAFVLGASLDRPWGERARAGLLLEHTRVTGSDEFGRNGRVYGVGPVFGIALSPSAAVDLSWTYSWGLLDGLAGGSNSRLSGYALALGLRTKGGSR